MKKVIFLALVYIICLMPCIAGINNGCSGSGGGTPAAAGDGIGITVVGGTNVFSIYPLTASNPLWNAMLGANNTWTGSSNSFSKVYVKNGSLSSVIDPNSVSVIGSSSSLRLTSTNGLQHWGVLNDYVSLDAKDGWQSVDHNANAASMSVNGGLSFNQLSGLSMSMDLQNSRFQVANAGGTGNLTYTNGSWWSDSPLHATTFTGNGAAITGLNGSSVSSGTVGDSYLSANVALYNANGNFTGTSNRFTKIYASYMDCSGAPTDPTDVVRLTDMQGGTFAASFTTLGSSGLLSGTNATFSGLVTGNGGGSFTTLALSGLLSGANANLTGVLGVGTNTPNAIIHGVAAAGSTNYNAMLLQGNLNNYFQVNVQNQNAGTNASTDIVCTTDTGTENSGYIDMGINSSGYNNPAYGDTLPLDSYILAMGGNLIINTGTAGKKIKFYTEGTGSANSRATIDSTGLSVDGSSGTLYSSNSITINSGTGNVILTAPLQFSDGSTITKAPAGQINVGTAFAALTSIGQQTTNTVAITGAIPNDGQTVTIGLPTDWPNMRRPYCVISATNTVLFITESLGNIGSYSNTAGPIAIKVLQ